MACLATRCMDFSRLPLTSGPNWSPPHQPPPGLLASPQSAPGNLENSKLSESRINSGSRENSTVDFSKVNVFSNACLCTSGHFWKDSRTKFQCPLSPCGMQNQADLSGQFCNTLVNLQLLPQVLIHARDLKHTSGGHPASKMEWNPAMLMQ